MNEPSPRTSIQGQTTTSNGLAFLTQLLAETDASAQLERAERSVAALAELPYHIPMDDEPGMLQDDEVLNWCFIEAISHLQSALWSASGGCYPTALTATRTALNVGLIALEFALVDQDEATSGARERSAEGAVGATTLAEWEGGAPAPDTAETMRRLSRRERFVQFAAREPIEIDTHVLTVDRELADPKRAHHLQNSFGPLQFSADGHAMVLSALHEVVGVIGACWAIAFPLVLQQRTEELRAERAAIFAHPWPAGVLAALTDELQPG